MGNMFGRFLLSCDNNVYVKSIEFFVDGAEEDIPLQLNAIPYRNFFYHRPLDEIFYKNEFGINISMDVEKAEKDGSTYFLYEVESHAYTRHQHLLNSTEKFIFLVPNKTLLRFTCCSTELTYENNYNSHLIIGKRRFIIKNNFEPLKKGTSYTLIYKPDYFTIIEENEAEFIIEDLSLYEEREIPNFIKMARDYYPSCQWSHSMVQSSTVKNLTVIKD